MFDTNKTKLGNKSCFWLLVTCFWLLVTGNCLAIDESYCQELVTSDQQLLFYKLKR